MTDTEKPLAPAVSLDKEKKGASDPSDVVSPIGDLPPEQDVIGEEDLPTNSGPCPEITANWFSKITFQWLTR
jgi:hypothetical protein